MPIHIHFKKGGAVTITPQGYSGQTCHHATGPYEEIMKGQRKVVETSDTSVQQVNKLSQVQQHKR